MPSGRRSPSTPGWPASAAGIGTPRIRPRRPIVWFNLRAHLAATLQTESRGGTTTRAALHCATSHRRPDRPGLRPALQRRPARRSLQRILATSSGFSTDNVLCGQVSLPWKSYKEPAERLAFAERLLASLRVIPGITHAALTTGLPFANRTNDSATCVEGRPAEPGQPLKAHYRSNVSTDYWSAMRIPLLRGRYLEEADSHRPARVCVVDQAFAQRYWPGADPIGRRIAQDIKVTEENAITIVGVVGEVKQGSLTENSGHGAVYFPHNGAFSFSLIVRTALPPEALAPAVRKAILEIDPGQPIDDLKPLQTLIDDSLVAHRSPAILAALFSAVALLLAALGTYGVLAYSVGQRQREIGVRMALGAQPHQILVQFLGLGSILLGIGLALGLVGTWATGLAMQSLLFGVGPMNLCVLAATAGVLLGVVFVALYLPSRRAARTDPNIALHSE
jgi:predicted permease